MVTPRPGRSGISIMAVDHREVLERELVEHRVGAERVLEDEAAGRDRGDVQAGGEGQRAAPEMRREAQLVGAGQRLDAHAPR